MPVSILADFVFNTFGILKRKRLWSNRASAPNRRRQGRLRQQRSSTTKPPSSPQEKLLNLSYPPSPSRFQRKWKDPVPPRPDCASFSKRKSPSAEDLVTAPLI